MSSLKGNHSPTVVAMLLVKGVLDDCFARNVSICVGVVRGSLVCVVCIGIFGGVGKEAGPVGYWRGESVCAKRELVSNSTGSLLSVKRLVLFIPKERDVERNVNGDVLEKGDERS